jgi:hypothetical protein
MNSVSECARARFNYDMVMYHHRGRVSSSRLTLITIHPRIRERRRFPPPRFEHRRLWVRPPKGGHFLLGRVRLG